MGPAHRCFPSCSPPTERFLGRSGGPILSATTTALRQPLGGAESPFQPSCLQFSGDLQVQIRQCHGAGVPLLSSVERIGPWVGPELRLLPHDFGLLHR